MQAVLEKIAYVFVAVHWLWAHAFVPARMCMQLATHSLLVALVHMLTGCHTRTF